MSRPVGGIPTVEGLSRLFFYTCVDILKNVLPFHQGASGMLQTKLNKCPVGLETSTSEIEKLKAQVPFP